MAVEPGSTSATATPDWAFKGKSAICDKTRSATRCLLSGYFALSLMLVFALTGDVLEHDGHIGRERIQDKVKAEELRREFIHIMNVDDDLDGDLLGQDHLGE